MKTIWNKIKFMFKEIVSIVIIMFALLLTIYFLDTNSNLSNIWIVLLGTVVVGILSILYLITSWNLSKFLCSYKTTAKLIDYSSVYHGEWENTPVADSYTTLLIVEYIYKKRKHKKSVMVPNMHKRIRVGSQLNIRVCKLLPRIIYVETN